MNCEEILQMTAGQEDVTDDKNLLDKKEKLYSLAVCGKTKQYLGTQLTIEQVQQLSPQDIIKYHARYESLLGARMVRSLGHTVIGIYSKVASRVFSVDSEADLAYDLTQDPVLSKTLETLSCDLYYRFGALLAPLVTGLITFNHIIKFNHKEKDGDESREGASGERYEPSGTRDESCGDPTNPSTSDNCY